MTCRGFGERRGRCPNEPGFRNISYPDGDRITVPSLCPSCEAAWRRNEDSLRPQELPPRRRGGFLGFEVEGLDTGIRRKVGRT